MDTRVLTNARFGWFAAAASTIPASNWLSGPTKTQLDLLTNVSEAHKVDGTDFNIEASEQAEDRSFTDAAGAQSRSYNAASGNLEIYTPGKGDYSSIYNTTWDLLSHTRTKLVVAQRPVVSSSAPLAAGDEINVFSVLTDERIHNRNDVSRTLGIGLLLQDNMLVNYIVPASTPGAITVAAQNSVDLEALEPGDIAFLKVTYQGRIITQGATYVSSDEDVFEVTKHGIIIAKAVGTATLTVSYPGAATLSPIDVEVTTP